MFFFAYLERDINTRATPSLPFEENDDMTPSVSDLIQSFEDMLDQHDAAPDSFKDDHEGKSILILFTETKQLTLYSLHQERL